MYHQFQRAEPKVKKSNIKTKLLDLFREVCPECSKKVCPKCSKDQSCSDPECSKKNQLCSKYNATRAKIIKYFHDYKFPTKSPDPAKSPEISLVVPLPKMEGKIVSNKLMTNIYIRFEKEIVRQRRKKESGNTYVSKRTNEPITTEADIKEKLIFIVGLLKKHYEIQ